MGKIKPLARYVYEPYGKINPYLTNLDLDRNQYFYKGKFYYTGMEWEEELQLYNFKARYYDPYTMRFIQPDPVHTEKTGFDNYDRYSYVNNNPVNFVDPTGESWLNEWFNPSRTKRHQNAWKQGLIIGTLLYGQQFLTDAYNNLVNFLKENSWIGIWRSKNNPFYKFFQQNQKFLLFILMQEMGMDIVKFLVMYKLADFITDSISKPDEFTGLFGHNYTGTANRDPFGGLYNKYDRMKWLGLFLFWVNAYNASDKTNQNDITMEEVMNFLILSTLLRAKPKSYMDSVAQWHDDHYPGGIGDNIGCLPGCKHYEDFLYADMGYISKFISGFTKKEFWDKPLDSILVGVAGSLLFGSIQGVKTFIL